MLLDKFRALKFFIIILNIYSQISQPIFILFKLFIDIEKPFLDNIFKKLFQIVLQDHFNILKLAQQLIVFLLDTHDLNLLDLEFLFKVCSFFLLDFKGFLKLVNH